MRSTTCTSILCHTDHFIFRHFCIVIFISRILLISLPNISNKKISCIEVMQSKKKKENKKVGGVIPMGLFCVAQCKCNSGMPSTYSITGLSGSCCSKTIAALQMLMADNGLTPMNHRSAQLHCAQNLIEVIILEWQLECFYLLFFTVFLHNFTLPKLKLTDHPIVL